MHNANWTRHILCHDVKLVRRACNKGLETNKKGTQNAQLFENIISAMDNVMKQMMDWGEELEKFRSSFVEPSFDELERIAGLLVETKMDKNLREHALEDLRTVKENLEHLSRATAPDHQKDALEADVRRMVLAVRDGKPQKDLDRIAGEIYDNSVAFTYDRHISKKQEQLGEF